MLGGDEEKDPDAAKKEEERQEALRQEEEERKAKYAKMEAEREAVRQGIRDKVGAAAALAPHPCVDGGGDGGGCCLPEGSVKPGWAAAPPPLKLAELTSGRDPQGGGWAGEAFTSAHTHRAWGLPCRLSPSGPDGRGWTPSSQDPGLGCWLL